MRRLFLLCLIVTALKINAQITLESLAGNDQLHYINYINQDLDSNSKWNYFNLNRFTYNYQDQTRNNISMEAQLTYQILPWIGISMGGGFYGELLIPSLGLGLGYLNKKEDFFLQLFPTIVYVEKQFAPSMLGLLNYSPKIGGNWGLSTQLLFSIDPVETAQLLRIGANFKEQLQFGLGIDLQKGWNSNSLYKNYGPFVRYTF